MTQEEAFEKLELPIGSDLQSIRKKFASMHNDYRMQIDNAFNPTSKRNFEQKLEELKEAYALLNESDQIDDNASLPRTGESFDEILNVDNKTEIDIESALALFGLRKDQDRKRIEQGIQKYLNELIQQRDQIHLVEAKEAYIKAINKAEIAKYIVEDWLKNAFVEEIVRQAQPPNHNQEVPQKRNLNGLLAVGFVILAGVAVFFYLNKNKTDNMEPAKAIAEDWKPTHVISTDLKETLVLRNRELSADELSKLSTDVALNGKTFAGDIKAGDSLLIIEERKDFFVVQPAKAELNKQYFLVKNTDSQKYLMAIGQNKVSTEDTSKLATATTVIPTGTEKPNTNWRKQYDEVGDFSEGYASVWLKNKVGFVDRNGREVVPILYDDANWFSEGLVAVQLGDKWGFVDKSGKVVVPIKYEYVPFYTFSEGLAYVKMNGKMGYINKSGDIVVPFKYDSAMGFKDGMGRVISNKKYGYVDRNGKEVIPPKYDSGQDFEEGFVRVRLNMKYGFLDKVGTVVVPIKYDQVHDYSHGFAAVQINKLWGYVDTKGNEEIPPKFDTAGDFRKNGQAGAKLNGKSIIINSKGEYIRDCTEC